MTALPPMHVLKTMEDADVATLLAEMRWPEGFRCRCGEQGHYRLAARPRVFGCRSCGHQTSVTANTLMHGSRKPLRVWLIAAVVEARGDTSALQLSRDLGIRYETVWRRLHRIRRAASDRHVSLHGTIWCARRAVKGVECWMPTHTFVLVDEHGTAAGVHEVRNSRTHEVERLMAQVAPGRPLPPLQGQTTPAHRAAHALRTKCHKLHLGVSRRWLCRYIDAFCASYTWRDNAAAYLLEHAIAARRQRFVDLTPLKVNRRLRTIAA